MVVKSVAISAYQQAMDVRRRSVDNTVAQKLRKPQQPVQGFSETLKESLTKVNNMQEEKTTMIEEFATGKRQNVHELMITMQKAGLAMEMTTAVRGKIMESYQKLMQIPF